MSYLFYHLHYILQPSIVHHTPQTTVASSSRGRGKGRGRGRGRGRGTGQSQPQPQAQPQPQPQPHTLHQPQPSPHANAWVSTGNTHNFFVYLLLTPPKLIVLTVSKYRQHGPGVWTAFTVTASNPCQCYCEHSSIIELLLLYCIMFKTFTVSLQSQGTVNTVRMYGPSSVQPHSQSQPQPQTNAFVSPQSTVLLYLLFFYDNFGIT